MLTSISPLGERARHNRWSVTAGAYAAGSVVAAGAVGGVLGGAGSLLPLAGATRAAVVALVAIAALVVDGGLLPLPTVRRQVNEDWLNRYRGWVYGAGFGAQLGVGVATIVTSATVYVALAAEAMVGSAVAGAAVGATFGLVRAAPLLAVRRTASYSQLVDQHRHLVALAPAGRRVTLAATVVGAAILSTAVVVAFTVGSPP